MVPAVKTSKTMNTILRIWVSTPTAATALSEYWLSMMTSIAPSSMMSRISTKMGAVRLKS